MATFGERLKEVRNKRKISQAKLGEYVGVSGATVTRWERGKFTPDPEMIKKLARKLNIHSGYLLGITNAPHVYEDDDVYEVQNIDPFRLDLEKVYEESEGKEIVLDGEVLSEEDALLWRTVMKNIIERRKKSKKEMGH